MGHHRGLADGTPTARRNQDEIKAADTTPCDHEHTTDANESQTGATKGQIGCLRLSCRACISMQAWASAPENRGLGRTRQEFPLFDAPKGPSSCAGRRTRVPGDNHGIRRDPGFAPDRHRSITTAPGVARPMRRIALCW
jgi:hypothetical protein